MVQNGSDSQPRTYQEERDPVLSAGSEKPDPCAVEFEGRPDSPLPPLPAAYLR